MALYCPFYENIRELCDVDTEAVCLQDWSDDNTSIDIDKLELNMIIDSKLKPCNWSSTCKQALDLNQGLSAAHTCCNRPRGAAHRGRVGAKRGKRGRRNRHIFLDRAPD